ncbi:MAG: hypothetical protein P8L37_00925 [Phycisphaerales bacterium]|nr:hypothetical protein [Phycisphaerales bacterium]
MQIVSQWIVIIIALACSIVMFLLIKPFLLSGTGTFGPTILQAQSPGPAIIALVAALTAGTCLACIVSRLLSTRDVLLHEVGIKLPTSLSLDPAHSKASTRGSSTSLLILGIGLGWTALQLESVQTVIISGSLGWLAAEGVGWGILLLFMSVVVLRFGGQFVTPMLDDDGQEDDWAMSTPALKMAASGACVLPVVWLIAQSPMKGQVIVATIIGSIAAWFVGRMIAPTVQPVLLFASVCVFGALGQWVAGMWLPEDPNVMVAAGTLPHIVLPLPIDYAAGALIGIPIGLSWSNGFLEKDDATNQAAAA